MPALLTFSVAYLSDPIDVPWTHDWILYTGYARSCSGTITRNILPSGVPMWKCPWAGMAAEGMTRSSSRLEWQ
jgi:hypothetical protein